MTKKCDSRREIFRFQDGGDVGFELSAVLLLRGNLNPGAVSSCMKGITRL
jgi:hypothetical protein